jgi:hypothetical protein
MGMRQNILKNAFYLTEMAAKELAQVVALIKLGKLKEAAHKYIDVGGNPASSGVSKTVNTHITKNPDLTPEERQYFEGFKSAVETARREKDIKTNRPETYKTGTTGMTKTGEAVVVKGLNARARSENVLKVIDKHKIEIDRERAMLDAGTDEGGLRKLAIEIVKDWKDAKLDAKDEEFKAILKNFSSTGNDKDKAIDIMHTIVDEGEKVMEALKKRVAAGGMVKPTETTMERLGARYKNIDKLKAEKAQAIEAQKQKQLEVKEDKNWYKDYQKKHPLKKTKKQHECKGCGNTALNAGEDYCSSCKEEKGIKEATIFENMIIFDANPTAVLLATIGVVFGASAGPLMIIKAKEWLSKKFGKQFTEAKLQEIAKKYRGFGLRLLKYEDIKKQMEELKVKPTNANFTRLYQMIAKIKTPPKRPPEETNEETLYESILFVEFLKIIPVVYKILAASFAGAAALNVVASIMQKHRQKIQQVKVSTEDVKEFLADPEYKKLVDAFNKNPAKENLDRLAKATNEKVKENKNDT